MIVIVQFYGQIIYVLYTVGTGFKCMHLCNEELLHKIQYIALFEFANR